MPESSDEMRSESEVSELMKAPLVALSERLGSEALAGEVLAAVLVKVQPDGSVTWDSANMIPPMAVGTMELALAALKKQSLV